MAQQRQPRANRQGRPVPRAGEASGRPRAQGAQGGGNRRRAQSRRQNPYETPYQTQQTRTRRPAGAVDARRRAPVHVAPSHARQPEPPRRGPIVPIIIALLVIVFVGLLVVFFLRSCGSQGSSGAVVTQEQTDGGATATEGTVDATEPEDDADATDADAKDGTSKKAPADASAAAEDARLDTLVLVNKEYELPDGWEDELDLVAGQSFDGYDVEVDRIAFDAFEDLQEDLLQNEGITIYLNSGYRSVAEQQQIMEEQIEVSGEDYVRDYVAKPGHSEHHTGLALDAKLVIDGVPLETNEQIFAEPETWAIVHSYLAKHGFILRYLDGMEDVTGYYYEPWHFRYVGKKDAKAIMDAGVTLEEYLDKVPDHSVAPGSGY